MNLFQMGQNVANEGLAQATNPYAYAQLLVKRMTCQDDYSRGLTAAAKEFLKNNPKPANLPVDERKLESL